MDVLEGIQEVITKILFIEDREITPETYLIRELDAESIDLLELAVALSARFQTDINEDDIFIKQLRLYITEAEEEGIEMVSYLSKMLPFLTRDRIEEILLDLEGGPALKVKDLVRYVVWQREQR